LESNHHRIPKLESFLIDQIRLLACIRKTFALSNITPRLCQPSPIQDTEQRQLLVCTPKILAVGRLASLFPRCPGVPIYATDPTPTRARMKMNLCMRHAVLAS
jgi:hypothetical protein